MCQTATFPGAARGLAIALLAVSGAVSAQTPPVSPGDPAKPEWRHIGNSAVEAELASPASGPVERVWFAADGSRLYVRTPAGRVFETADFEQWQPSSAAPPQEPEATIRPATLPDGGSLWRRHPSDRRLYAFGGQVFRSDDGGVTWSNLTQLERTSIIGGGMRDLAIAPTDPDEIVVANQFGLWRSLDGGRSWSGLNEALPNLPGTRFTALPESTRGVRLAADGYGVIEWVPGEKRAWRPVSDSAAADEAARRRSIGGVLGADVTAVASSGDHVYAGSADGRLWASLDRGKTWSASAAAERGAIRGFWVDTRDPRTALAVTAGAKANRVLRTVNGGQYWDDLSSDLPEGAVFAVTADRPSGSVYVAADKGVYFTHADLLAAAPANRWTAVGGLPDARVLDVRLDADGNQLFAVVEGNGVYAAMAPHRRGNLRLVNAADFSTRPAAPGSLLSVLGGRVSAARAGDVAFPVLAASDSETQIQVPFWVSGPSVFVALDTGGGRVRLSVPVENVAPAIFVDRDGTPLLLNADSGVLLDVMNPARSNARLQVLATGLGRVRPDWPAGRPGPSDAPPQVIAPVKAYLDGAPVDVTRAVLAPGYVGLYLVEVQLPAIVNAGPAELYIEADGQASNRVRIDIEP